VKAFEADSVVPFDRRLYLVLAIRNGGNGRLYRHNADLFRTKARRSCRLLIDSIASLTSAADGGTKAGDRSGQCLRGKLASCAKRVINESTAWETAADQISLQMSTRTFFLLALGIGEIVAVRLGWARLGTLFACRERDPALMREERFRQHQIRQASIQQSV
jgi:hypothetical protein